ncbi:merozoite surface protein 1-like [Camponotus floridanus]|uniref:merozoite surface protein 1-like n=1 Tax=Camponotus floridanus TaxID=104421 RepID=UPI000DC6AE84|nr:merozoite surface protein 1-like [Camponotus floridanus]
MFVDILGRIKQWSGIVQNKLDACKNEIGNLHKELLARACEMDVLKAQITEYQNPSLLDESSKKNHKIIRPEQEKENKKIHAENSLAEDKKITNKDIVQVVDQIEKGDEERTEEVRIINQTLNYQEIKNTIQITDQTDEEVKIKMKEERARIVDKENEEEPVLKKEIKEDQIEATMAAPTTVLNKTKRESELESEITLLRKEYNRVIKERAEYENAIQRALLRGVSSLNVEALRVLRCPPIPCCIPCAPCPATAGIIPPEPVVPCPAKSAKRRSGSTTATMNNATVPRDSDQINCRTKRPCNSPCCFVDRSRKSADGSMIFLLRQDNERNLRDEDAIPICGSTIVKKIELPPLRRFETATCN